MAARKIKIKDIVYLPGAERVREEWIKAVRLFHQRKHGGISKYNSNPMWDGGYDVKTYRNYSKPIWNDIVALHKAEDVSTDAVIFYVFKHWMSDQAPTPRELLNIHNVKNARNMWQEDCHAIRVRLTSDRNKLLSARWQVLQTTPDPEQAAKIALNDAGNSLSPLFRYCVALKMGHDDIAERWKKAAEIQFLKSPMAYVSDKEWGDLLPSDVISEYKK